MTRQIVTLAGDGIGPEVMREALEVLAAVDARFDLGLETEAMPLGGAGYEVSGDPLPADTLDACRAADAILMGSIGGPAYDALPRHLRPERGLLRLRSELALFANLRPALLFAELAEASSLRAPLVAGLDIMIVRELTGGLYFGEPRGLRHGENGREGFNTMRYDEAEIRRIAVRAFEIAQKRGRRLCSVDKANVLEVSELWRDVVSETAADYPDVELSHLYVDNAAMQLVRAPKQFDVIVTENLFGDILSDAAAMLTGSIGMLPSASLDANGKGLYEPVHGSAPDIAGQDVANPLAAILSAAMMLRYTLDAPNAADAIEGAVSAVLAAGLRSVDIAGERSELERVVGTRAMGAAVVEAITHPDRAAAR